MLGKQYSARSPSILVISKGFFTGELGGPKSNVGKGEIPAMQAKCGVDAQKRAK